MNIRMWRSTAPEVSIEGKKGYFDVAYGNESESQKLDVWLPEGEGPFPAIISIHGGGFIACDKRYGEMITPMLSGLDKGFAVIGLNYRLCTEAIYPNPVKDIKQGIRFIKAHADEWGINADKLIPWGGSAGAYMCLMACLCGEDPYFDNPNDPNLNISAKVAGGIAWYPSTDFTTCDEELKTNGILNSFLHYELSDINEEYAPAMPLSNECDFPYHDAEDSPSALFLGEPVQSNLGITASPIYRLHKKIPPLFVQHGSADQILPVQQSIRFALKANELCGEERVTLDIIPNAIHSSVLFETDENLDKIYNFISNKIL